MSVHALLIIIFAIFVALCMIFGNKWHRLFAFLALVPLTWVIVLTAPLGPPLLIGKEEVNEVVELAKEAGRAIGFDGKPERGYGREVLLFGKEEADRRLAERQKAYEAAAREEKKPAKHPVPEETYPDRAKSWTPFLLLFGLAGVWTIFAPLYAVFSVVAQARSNPSSRVNNDFIKWTIGILVVYLLFKFKWLGGNDGSALRRSIEYFGLHVFYNWLLK